MTNYKEFLARLGIDVQQAVTNRPASANGKSQSAQFGRKPRENNVCFSVLTASGRGRTASLSLRGRETGVEGDHSVNKRAASAGQHTGGRSLHETERQFRILVKNFLKLLLANLDSLVEPPRKIYKSLKES